MDLADVIGSLGVTLILAAFVLNLAGVLSRNARSYLLLNFGGATLACASSALIGFVPFVVLEAVWALAALGGLVARRA